MQSTPHARPHPWVRCCWALALWPVVGAANAATISGEQLANVAPDSGDVSFSAADLPGVQLRVTELGAATMSGSDLFGYTGLWLGAAGNGGRYSLQFSTPVQQLALSFVALTTLGGDEYEQVSDLVTDQAVAISLQSPDNSAAWDGSLLVPLDEDSRGTLQLVALQPQGFSRLSFSHLQAAPLQGWVISQIQFDLQPVPEPTPMALLACGLWMLWHHARRA